MAVESNQELTIQRRIGAGNPVYSGYLADPFVFAADGNYFAVGTGPGTDDMELPLLRSADFIHWESIGHALSTPHVEGDCFWAPEVAFADGCFYLYYSVGHSDSGHHLRVAVSHRPEGPYADVGHPVLNPKSTPFAIDASPFQDVDGQWYLYYARDFVEPDAEGRSGTGLVVAPLIDMVRIEDDFEIVMRASHDWQRYEADRQIYGGVYDWHTLEGPSVLRRGTRYYCFYSGGNWQNDSYGVDWLVADHPMGPFRDTNPGSGPRVLTTIPGSVIGPGHNSFVQGPDGATYIAYHAWGLDRAARRLCLDLIHWSEAGPICLGPTWKGSAEDQ
ncbi:MAG: glycoside hydrolase family 43 protein [Fimbriimonas sp.]|nr:glycoside hydrolase family 43 protein [Fimbriimonas sp.]